MSDYEVSAILQLQGVDITVHGYLKVADAAREASSAMSAAEHAGGGFGGPLLAGLAAAAAGANQLLRELESIVLAAGSAALGLAEMGATAAFEQIKDSITEVNATVEQSEVGFATLFRLFNTAPNWDSALGQGMTLMEQIRADAAALPGETQDFVRMAQTMTAPLAQAGKGIAEIRLLTKQTAVAAAALADGGKVTGHHFAQAAAQMSKMMMGHVSALVPLASKLGINKDTKIGAHGEHTFKTGTVDERLAYVTERLKPTEEAVKALEKTWDGVTSTLVDKWKMVRGAASAPLFESIKMDLIKLSDWFDDHKGTLLSGAQEIGVHLVAAYRMGRDAAIELYGWVGKHWGAIEDKAAAIWHGMEDAIRRVWPVAEAFVGWLGQELQHPLDLIGKYAVLRGALSIAEALPTLGATYLGASWGAGAAGGGAAAGAVAEGVAAVGVEGAAAGGMLAALGGAAIPLIVTFGALVGVGDIFMRAQEANSDKLVGAGLWMAAQLGTATDLAYKELSEFGMNAWQGVRPIFDMLGTALLGMLTFVVMVTGGLAGMANELRSWIREKAKDNSWVRPVVDVAGAAVGGGLGLVAGPWGGVAGVGVGYTFTDQYLFGEDKALPGAAAAAAAPSALEKLQDEYGKQLAQARKEAEERAAERKRLMAEGAGGGNKVAPTHIDARGSNFNVTIDAKNMDPDRIVRRMYSSIGDELMRPLTAGPPARAY